MYESVQTFTPLPCWRFTLGISWFSTRFFLTTEQFIPLFVDQFFKPSDGFPNLSDDFLLDFFVRLVWSWIPKVSWKLLMVSTWHDNIVGFVWIFEPKLQGEFAPLPCGANLKQTPGASCLTLSNLRHRRGLHGFLQSFRPKALVNPWEVVEMVVEAPIFGPSKKNVEHLDVVSRFVGFLFSYTFGDRTL